MKVVVLSPYYPPAFLAGGPVKSVSQLVRAPGNHFETLVLSRNWDLGDRTQLRSGPDRWVYVGPETVWLRGPGLVPYLRCLRELWRLRADLLYVNSLFDPWMALIPALLWNVFGRRHATLVVAPRGQTGAEALSKSRYRKRPLLWAWRRLVRGRRVIWHAASDQEQRDIERAVGAERVVVRANDVGPLLPTMEGPGASAQTRAVFLGRVVPIKGLLQLLTALQEVAVPLSLDVFGPFEDPAYLARCRQQAGALPANIQVEFKGPAPSDQVRARLAQYDVMLNPTRGESFGQATGESLSVGTPVAIADVTPWTTWIRRTAGGQIVQDDQWASQIEAMAICGPTQQQQRRRAARQAYEDWWHEAQEQPHLFAMVAAAVAER